MKSMYIYIYILNMDEISMKSMYIYIIYIAYILNQYKLLVY